MRPFLWTVAALVSLSGFSDETEELQRRIDEVSESGGGRVVISAGDHPITSVFLKSNVTLELQKGARLYAASTNRDDYMDAVLGIRGDSKVRKWRDCATAVICGNNATNIAIVGEGTVDGCGSRLFELEQTPARYRNVVLYRCRGIRLEGISLVNSARWTCYLKECEDVTVRRVKVRSLGCWNNDGIDLEAKRVLIEDCDIEADDDAVCLKTFSPDFVCEDVEIRNCRIASNCQHFKIGTETFGGFRNISIHDCVFESCSTNVIVQIKNRYKDNLVSGWNPDEIVSRSGLAVECVDGGFVENVVARNIAMGRSTQTPIFIRLGARHAPAAGRKSYLRNITIDGVTAEAASQIASSITGVPGLRPQGIAIRNVKLKLMGGVTKEAASLPVPEAVNGYPMNRMFKGHVLPAYGFYVRHADGVAFENVELSLDREDARPPIFTDDVTNVQGAALCSGDEGQRFPEKCKE